MSKLLRLPGLIDIHVHLRDPGQTYKEDFYTGTSSALAGGVTLVFDMPNNLEPIFTHQKLIEKIKIAKQKAVCDIGLYFGTDGKNTDQFEKVVDKVIGLKVYLGMTTGRFVIEDDELVEIVFRSWPKNKIIVVHTEGEKIDLAIKLCGKFGNKVHITHIATKKDLEKIIEAKKDKLDLTCDVTPHHLFLTKEDIGVYSSSPDIHRGKLESRSLQSDSSRLRSNNNILPNSFYEVKPPLAIQTDVDYLWDHLADIDCIASDHAPHTIEEKQSTNPLSGMPGLETMLPLLINASEEGKLSITDVIRLTNTNPQKLFGIKQDENTSVQVDPEEEYIIENKDLKTKCGWSPFNGWRVKGKVKNVYIRGIKVFEMGKILVNPGFGKFIS